jgi:hypothetical protein
VNTANGKTRSRDIRKIRITLRNQELVLKNLIYKIHLRLNILSTERFKKDSYMDYNNLFLYCFYDGTFGKILIEADEFLGILIIILNQSKELNHFKALELYYSNTENRKISLNLAYRRLSHIQRKLTRKLIHEIFIKFTLMGKESDYGRYDEYIFEQIKVKFFSNN